MLCKIIAKCCRFSRNSVNYSGVKRLQWGSTWQSTNCVAACNHNLLSLRTESKIIFRLPLGFHQVAEFISGCREISSTTSKSKLTPDELKKRVDEITYLYAEARERLGDARESIGTDHFSEDMCDAQEAVKTTLTAYDILLEELNSGQRQEIIKTLGLRMGELKVQEQAIRDLLD